MKTNLFLKRYKEIVSPFVDTYCWCLLPNHFHLLIKIKTEYNIRALFNDKLKAELTLTEHKFLKENLGLSELIEITFKRFFQSYAMAYNKMFNRTGNLFYKPFKRIQIEKDSQFTMVLIYILANAVRHKLVNILDEYKWSSWRSVLSDRPTLIKRTEIINWFGSLPNCIKVHHEMVAFYFECPMAIEE
jgi:REP element-mobilizing transposase RayT